MDSNMQVLLCYSHHILVLVSSPLLLWLCFEQGTLIRVFQDHLLSMVALTTLDEVRKMLWAIQMSYPVLTNVWGALDSPNLTIEWLGNKNKQNRICNGWTYDHCLSNLFTFITHTQEGKKVIHKCTWMLAWFHPWRVMQYVFKVGRHWSINWCSNRCRWRLLLGKWCIDFEITLTILDRQSCICAPNNAFGVATSVRQLFERRKRGFQDLLPWLKDHLRYKERGEQHVVLHLVLLLYNFCPETVRDTQIFSASCHT